MFKRKGGKAAFIAVCLLLSGISLFIYYQRDYLNENPLGITHTFRQPSFAVTNSDGTLLVIEHSKTRVSLLSNNNVASVIYGGKNKNGFYYAEYAAADSESIYISDVKYAEGSLAIETERIMRYTRDGRFRAILFEKAYEDDKPLQYGNIRGLQIQNGVLTFLLKSDESLDLYTISDEKASLVRKVHTGNGSHIRNVHYNHASDKVYAMTMYGELFCESDGELSLYRSWADAGQESVPWEIGSDDSGTVYLTDLSSRGVVSLPEYETVYKSENIVYRLTVSDNNILTLTDNTSVFQMRTDGSEFLKVTALRYDAGHLLMRLVVWIMAVLLGVSVLYILVRIFILLMKGNQTRSFRILLLVVVSTVLTAIIVTASILSDNIKKDSEKNRITLTQMCLSLSGLSGDTFGDDLASIRLLSDYRGEAYQRVRRYLDPVCLTAAQQGSNMYYLLYKYEGNTLYGVMDYEDTFGTIYPMYDFAGSGYDEVANGDAPYLFEISSDSYGTWMYAAAPVFNSQGSIVGLIEIGSDLYGETLHRNRQITEIIVSTSVLLVLFLLVFSEVIGLAESVSERRLSAGQNSSNGIPELIRPLIFLAFLADNTGAAFVPQLSASIFADSGLTFAQTLGAALPMSVKLLFMAITALLGGALIDKWGMKLILAGGVAAQMTGLALTGLAVSQHNYILLLAAETVAGGGLGLIVVSGNILPVYSEDEDRRNSLFSGVNIGITSGVVVGASVGSYIAAAAGYAAVFIISAVLLIPSFVMSFLCTPHITERSGIEESEESGKLQIGSFLRQKSVISFLVFIMLPFLVILSFKDYVFPLFASGEGYSDVAIGQALLFSGALAIFAAPALSEKLLKRFGAEAANLFAGALFSTSLILFAIVPSWRSSVFAVFILNLAGCFGLVAQSVFFSSMRAVKQLGIGRAMGLFSLFDNLSQTVGPLLFGALMVFGARIACFVIGAAAFAMLVLFALLNRKEKTGSKA